MRQSYRIMIGTMALAAAPVIFGLSAEAQGREEKAGPQRGAPGMERRSDGQEGQGAWRRGGGRGQQFNRRRNFGQQWRHRGRNFNQRGWGRRGFGGQGFGQRRGRMGRPFRQDFGPRRGFPGRGPVWMNNPMMRERLGLTPDQVSRLQAQTEALERAGIQRRADTELRQRELDALMRSANPDRAAVEGKMRELNELRFAEQKAGLDMRYGADQVLTPEQRQKLNEMRNEGGQGMQERMRPRRPAPPAPPAQQTPPPGEQE